MSDFMGSMFAANIVAGEIAHQGRMSRQQNADGQRYAGDNANLRQRDRELVDRHNQLARNYNELLRHNAKLGRQFDEQSAEIERLRAEKAALEAECERLRFRVLDVSSELAVLRDLDKQLNPDAYPLG